MVNPGIPPSSGAASAGVGVGAGGGVDAGAGGSNAGAGGSNAGSSIPDAGALGSHGCPPAPEPYEVFPDLPPRTSPPVSDEEIVVPFTMKGVDHRLRLIPSQPLPRLIMESAPDDFEDKATNEIAEQASQGDSDEVAALETLRTAAHQVVTSADERDFGVIPGVPVPEVQELATEVHTYAEQFDETDLNDGLPAEAAAPYDPAEPVPPETVQRMPWDDFVALVDATENAVDALVLVEREHAFLDIEFGDVNRWLNANGRGPGYSAAIDRRSSITTKLGWCIRRERALRTAVNPNARVALPCFPAGTIVQTPRGARAIELLRVGDDVWSEDPETGAVVASQVEGLLVNRAVDLVVLRAGDQELVCATANHPCWDDGARAWVPAGAIVPGATLRTRTAVVTVTAVERRSIAAAPTFNLALGPVPTFFVGAGVLVHNGSYALWHTYPWASQHNFKIYIGLNDAAEFRDYVYVGQTKQAILEREEDHNAEAVRKLRDRSSLTADQVLFYRFKEGMRLTEICNGLKGESVRHSDQARYLEQKNIEAERGERGAQFVLNQIEASENPSELERRILNDPDCDVRAAGYCR